MTDYKTDQTFAKVIDLVIQAEGGYVNDPHDRGGPTKFGVAWNFNAEYLKLKCGMENPTDIENLTLDQAKQLYFDKYWIPSGAQGISSTSLAYLHLDTAINCGTAEALVFLGRCGHPRTMDGKNNANKGYFRGVMLMYVSQRLRYYTACHDWDRYGQGWTNRVAFVIDKALAID